MLNKYQCLDVSRSHSLELEMIELNFPLLFWIMENERSNVWVWILWIVIRGNYAIWLKHFVYWGKSDLGVTENSLMSLGGGGVRKKMYQIKKTPPPPSVTLWMKGTKIYNLNLSKFDCQNLLFRRSLASSKLMNPFLFPQELKFNLKTTSKTIQ